MSPRDWTEMTAAYVLGSLDPEELASFEQRLASDPELERDVESYREVMGALAGATPAREPPAALKERILVEARGRSASPPSPAPQGPGGSKGRGTALPWLLAAAGVVVSLGLGTAYQRMRTENATLRVAYDRVASDLEARDSLLATFLGARRANGDAGGHRSTPVGPAVLEHHNQLGGGGGVRPTAGRARPHLSALGDRDRPRPGEPRHLPDEDQRDGDLPTPGAGRLRVRARGRHRGARRRIAPADLHTVPGRRLVHSALI